MDTSSSADAVWSQLRASRSDPPAPAATDGLRRRTYVSALEQAEQMFRAAVTVGPATRPLLVFYGLSQAGRAIAAASAKAAGPGDWRLVGHGIGTGRLDGRLQEVQVFTDGPDRSSFKRLSYLLDSPTWSKQDPVALGKLWDTLPENRPWPLSTETDDRRTALYLAISEYPDEHPLASAAVSDMPPWLVMSQGREALDRFMAAYPNVGGYDFVRTGHHPDLTPDYRLHHDNWGELVMHWRVKDGRVGTVDERRQRILEFAQSYGGSMYLFPMVGSNDSSLHPLMTWWAILYALSILARYQPAEWARHIDVDVSQYAVAIERLLSEALTVVPSLVAETIRQVC